MFLLIKDILKSLHWIPISFVCLYFLVSLFYVPFCDHNTKLSGRHLCKEPMDVLSLRRLNGGES